MTIAVHCVDCDWQADLTEGGYAFTPDVEDMPDTVGPLLCRNCRNVVSVRRRHADERDVSDVPCPQCGLTCLTEWPGRDDELLLHRAAAAGRLGGCPRCGGRVESTGVEMLWD